MLTVAPKFVEPPAEELARIKAESELKSKVFAASAAEPLWSGDFRAGNGLRDEQFRHEAYLQWNAGQRAQGDGFSCGDWNTRARGEQWHRGVGAAARYEGNCVVIDHGLGLYTVSMHLSRIDVKEGQHIKLGERIGLSGATGRVTGPHLHWAVRWQDAYLDPAKMLRMDLNAAR